MINRYMKKYSTSSVSRQIQMKTVSKYYYIYRKIDKMENDIELTGTLITAGENVN